VNAAQKFQQQGVDATDFGKLRNQVTESLSKPIFDSWRDSRAAAAAVDSRVTILESKLPSVTAENTKDLVERIGNLEQKISTLEKR
jgi:hypothetical protein